MSARHGSLARVTGYLAGLALIWTASCSDTSGDVPAPTGGAAGHTGGTFGASGSINAGTSGAAPTSGAGGQGGGVAGGSNGGVTSGGTSAGRAGAAGSGASSQGGAGTGGAGGASSGGGGSAAGGSAGAGGGAAGSGTGGGGSMKSAGCGQAPKVTSGTKTIQSGGKDRTYMIRVPENYDQTHPYWLIFGFHWVGGTANDVDGGGTSGYTWSYYGLRELADKSTNSKAIFVAPQGISNGWGNSGNEDVKLTDDIIKQVEDGLCVDTKHIFSTGFSYGGGMTKALGCQRPNVFRAIAVYSGADFLSGGCDATTTSPIAYIGLHSISDGTNAYSSGITILNRFASNDGCTAQTPPQPPQGSNTHVCTTFAGCKQGYPVEWCAFNGGGHSPAPVDGSTNGSGGGDKTWTKAEVWKFFTQF